MLYLFNSAFRPLYLTNVLNTLALPQGYNNEYRYKHSGESRQITPAFFSTLSTIRNEECVMIFIDRFGAGGYIYHPLRFGKFVLYRDVNEYIHFRVQLGEFVYPRQIEQFNRDLVQALAPHGLPILTNGDQQNTRDGNYAIRSGSIFGNAEAYQIGKNAWNSAVEELAKTQALATTEQQSPIFIMIDVIDPQKQKIVQPDRHHGTTGYKLHKNDIYELILTYRFPRQRTDQKSKARLQLDFGDSIKGPGETVVDSHANSVPLPFATRRYIEETAGSIIIEALQEPNKPQILLARISLGYELKEAAGFWVQAVVGLLLFSLIGTLIGVDITKIEPFTLSALLHAARLKLILSLIQTAVLFWLFKLIGKNIF